MEKLIIDRSKWRTGHTGEYKTGLGPTSLLNDERFMCCLGFESLRLGCTPQEILGMGEPAEVYKNIGHLNKYEPEEKNHEYGDYGPFCLNTIFTEKAMKINDDDKITSEEREVKIKEHFATVGVEVEFINDYVRPE